MKLTAKPLAILLLLLGTPAEAKKQPLPKPETILCPKAPADLEYGLYSTMNAAGFEKDPTGGYQAYRRDATNVSELLKGSPRYLRVEFQTFPTSEGTRLIAELAYVTAYQVKEVRDPKIIAIFQDMLDQMRAASPCG